MENRIKEALKLLPIKEHALVKHYIEKLEREIFGLKTTVAHCREKEEKWFGVRKGDVNE